MIKPSNTEIGTNIKYEYQNIKQQQQQQIHLNLHENIRNKLNGFYISQRIPHLLFHGSPGTGKRTLVYDFIHKIYKGDKYKLKTNVMFVNCAHGKGIKFIRDELKFFAKTNIQGNQDIPFKTIALFNADSLTIDAQSAIRRCIELFSYNTRFFIIVENKHKMLNPILSRFCEIYVPEYMNINGKVQNLHQVHLLSKYGAVADQDERIDWFYERLGIDKGPSVINDNPPVLERSVGASRRSSSKIQDLTQIVSDAYELGYSCLDLMDFVKSPNSQLSAIQKVDSSMCFQKIKSEFRCEKLLMLYMLDQIYVEKTEVDGK